MFDCTFVSSDPDRYYEVECPVNYLGVSHQLKWYVSSINTMFSVIMFSPEDYIEYKLGPAIDEEHKKIFLSQYFKSFDEGVIESLNEGFKNAGEGITITTDNLGRTQIDSMDYIEIIGISYALQQALGFYYIKDVSANNPIKSQGTGNGYVIHAKAIGYTNLSHVWYLLSNLGSPNLITTMYSPYETYYPAIAMKIQNQFSPDQFLQYSNSDFMSVSQASSLANLRVKLVDINLKPVKLLSPLVVTVSFFEMAEEHAEIEEAMAEQETNPDVKKAIKEKQATNYKNLVENLKKRLKGVASDNEDLEAPEEQRGNEMAENVQAQNAETEVAVAAQDIHED